MSSRMPFFNSPLLLGFDQFERTLDRVAKASSDGYPPYNIEQIGEHGLRITLAVAGFTVEDLQVTVGENQLTVRGRQSDDRDRIYLHRGIASRQFQRSFVLAEGVQVVAASLDNGLLHIDLKRPQPEATVRTIKIEKARTKTKTSGPATIDVDGQQKVATKTTDKSSPEPNE